MSPANVVASSLQAIALVAVAFTACDAAPAAGPAGLAFYDPPAPLTPGTPGQVIWSRPLTGRAVLADAASNTLVLYHERSLTGADVAVSGTVAVPKGTPPAGGWPVISWAHGTTGNAPQCTPSRLSGDDFEWPFLNRFVERGYAVVATDYEGQGVPGPIHPYMAGRAAAHDVTDMVRAARSVVPNLSSRWVVLGHSEGGSAAIFTAGLGAGYAPDLTLVGAVAYAPASHVGSVLRFLPETGPSPSMVFTLEMIEGIASVDPSIDPARLLTDPALRATQQLQERCNDDLMNDRTFATLAGTDIFRPGADLTALQNDFDRNESNRVVVRVPLLLMQGTDDEVVRERISAATATDLCRAPDARVQYDVVRGKTHRSIVDDTLPAVATWLESVFGGGSAPSSC